MPAYQENNSRAFQGSLLAAVIFGILALTFHSGQESYKRCLAEANENIRSGNEKLAVAKQSREGTPTEEVSCEADSSGPEFNL